MLLIPLGLGACASSVPPPSLAVDVPAAFKEGVPGASVWRTAEPPQAVPGEWWLLFADPVLTQLEQQAQAANQNVAQSVARLRAARAAVDASSAPLLPALGGNAAATRAHAAGSHSTSYALGLAASWELDVWGRLSGTVEAARANAQASAADVAALRLSVQANVAHTYFALRAAEAQGQLLDETLAAYARSLELTRNRYRAGVASSADVAQAQAQHLSAQVQRAESATTRAQLEHALAALVGQAPAAFSLPPTAALPVPPAVPAQLPAHLLARRPDIAAAQQRVAAANAQVGVARAAYFPALTLSASTGYRGASLAHLFSAPQWVWSLGPALAASVFDGGARAAQEQSAQAALEQAAASYRQTVLTALQEVEDNLSAGVALEQQQALQQDAVAATQQALAVVGNQYRAGTVGYLNVLSAQTQALAAQRSLIDVKNRRLAVAVTLLKNVAGRWDAQADVGAATSPESAARTGG